MKKFEITIKRKQMTETLLESLAIFLLLFGLGACTASGAELYFQPQETVLVGSTTTETLDLYLDDAPAGYIYYNLTLSITNSSVARITEVTGVNSNSTLPAASVWVKATDNVNAGDSNLLLCTLTVESLALGETNISISPILQNKNGNIQAEIQEAKIKVNNPTVSVLPTNAKISPNNEQVFEVKVNKLPAGISGYDFNLILENPELGKFTKVEFPSWVDLSENSSLPTTSINLRAMQLGKEIQPGAENVTLANITFQNENPGESNVSLTFNRFNDDAGNDVTPILESASLKVLESEWLQFQKNSTHSAYSFTNTPTMDPEVLWQSLASPDQEPWGSGGINVPPVVSENKVFVTAGNASVWAFEKNNGTLIWSKELGGEDTQTSTPALGDGKLFVPTTEGELYTLDPEDGNILWSTQVTNGSLECPVTYSDHKLYLGEGLVGGVADKYYYCYADNGTLLWKHESKSTSGFIWSGAVVVGDYLIYPVFEGQMISLNKTTGEFIDEVNFSNSTDVSFAKEDLGMFRCAVSYANGALYTSSENGQDTGYCFKVGFDPETGKFRKEIGWATSIGFSTSTPVVYDDRVYVGHGEHGYTGALFCLDNSDGSVIWKTNVSGGVKSSPVLAIQDGKPYIYFTEALSDGSIYCLNPDGSLAWHYNPPEDSAYTLQGAALSDGKVYYGTDNGYLYCIEQGEALPPVASFSSDKQQGVLPLTVTFTDESFNANEFLWGFGDGSTSTEVNPIHTYTTAGSYTVTLTVKNTHGENAIIAEDYIYVASIPTTHIVTNGESIQAAIDAAKEGDIVRVNSGEYNEGLKIDKTLTVEGIKNPVLNASGKGIGVTISADDCKLSGFKIIETDSLCFAIRVDASGALIEDNVIDNCSEGIQLQQSGNTLKKNNISNCWDYAAVYDTGGSNQIYQNTFINNHGTKMGGSSYHIIGGSDSSFSTPEPVEYFWKGENLTGYMGNYYDDCSGNDSDGNGIGDTAYSAGAGIDNSPLMLPYSDYIEGNEQGPIPEDSWYQFHGTVNHIGYSENGPKTNRTEWISEDINALGSSSPVVAEGKVFVISGTSDMSGGSAGLVALNESTGDTLWNIAIPKTVSGSWASPAYDDSMVFVGTSEFGCYDAETGEKIWNYSDITGSVNGGPAIADGMVVFSDWSGLCYYCFDEYKGNLLWSFRVSATPQSVPVYADGKFYFTCYTKAYCVDAVTGKEIWSVDTTDISVDNLCGTPAYKNGILYLASYDFYGPGEIFAMNASDGSVIWRHDIISTDSTLAVAYGNVYACGGWSGTFYTYCFNATNGSLAWQKSGVGSWTQSVAVADGLVYAGINGEGYFTSSGICAFNAYTGETVWVSSNGGGSPALSDGMLFSIGGDYRVYCFKDIANETKRAELVVSGINLQSEILANNSSTVEAVINNTGSKTAGKFNATLSVNEEVVDTQTVPEITSGSSATVAFSWMPIAGGSYTLTVTADSENEIEESDEIDNTLTVNATVLASPVANFTSNVTSGKVPLTIQFTDTSANSPSAWVWDFDNDGNVDSTAQNPVYTYTSVGNYTVKLNVTNSAGSDEEIKTDYIKTTSDSTNGTTPVISLKVSPSFLEFGELSPGKVSASQNLTLKNNGSCRIKVTAEVTDNLEGDDLYTRGLWLDSAFWSSFYKDIESSSQADSAVSLHVPANYTGTGNKKGTITFWAEAAE